MTMPASLLRLKCEAYFQAGGADAGGKAENRYRLAIASASS